MIYKELLGFALCVGVAAGASAVPAIESWETKNGAKVLFVRAAELPMVDVRIVFDAGSARDNGKAGAAMLSNGLLAEGAGGKTSDQIAEGFANLGANFGNGALRDMGFVSLRSITAADKLNPALDLMATVLQKPDFPNNAFARERSRMLIALQARQQSPESVAEDAYFKAVYGEHPYAGYPGGTEASVKALSTADLKTFYKKYYVAKNAILAVVGDVTREQAAAIAEKLTAPLPAGEHAPALPPVQPLDKPPLDKSREQRIPYPSAQTHVLLGQPGLKRGEPELFPLYVGNHPLGGSGLVSRLSDVIREQRGLSYSVYSYFTPMRELGPFTAGLQTANENTEAATKLLRDTIAEYVKTGPTEKELNDSKKNITGGFALNLDSNSKITEQVAMIGFYGLPLDYLNTYIDHVNAVTREAAQKAIAGRLKPEAMVTVIVGGGGGAGGSGETEAPAQKPAAKAGGPG
jgi:zinc protease